MEKLPQWFENIKERDVEDFASSFLESYCDRYFDVFYVVFAIKKYSKNIIKYKFIHIKLLLIKYWLHNNL